MDRYPSSHAIRERGQYLPIHPNQPHPDSGEVLFVKGDQLRKNSFVNIRDVHYCDLSSLHHHGNRRLKRASLSLVRQHAPPEVSDSHVYTVNEHNWEDRMFHSYLRTDDELHRIASPIRSAYSLHPPQWNLSRAGIPPQRKVVIQQSSQIISYSPTITPTRTRQYTYNTFNSSSTPLRSPRPKSRWELFASIILWLVALTFIGIVCYSIYIFVIFLVAVISGWIDNALRFLNGIANGLKSVYEAVKSALEEILRKLIGP
jgi:hypothetical protein